MATAQEIRQIREQAAREANKAETEPKTEPETESKVKPRETAADRRNFYRKQAGWPPLRTK